MNFPTPSLLLRVSIVALVAGSHTIATWPIWFGPRKESQKTRSPGRSLPGWIRRPLPLASQSLWAPAARGIFDTNLPVGRLCKLEQSHACAAAAEDVPVANMAIRPVQHFANPGVGHPRFVGIAGPFPWPQSSALPWTVPPP